ncbi:hypothetical protein L3Y34_011993 [Caenorhabditis briggsae]|uniref:Profilin n=1 Tax=Caenorhabditis briggsae TaxID=6238 RepID=A0AAE8ZSV6_CAEBR|nr:hypothetical protein L3Y34_011993 [Caenorhabditis briggsae]
MAGWDDYINILLQKSSAIKRAAIIGTDGSIWARTNDGGAFRATDAELKKFAALFANIKSVPGTGADLEGVHYIVPRVEEKLIFGKKEQTGFFAAKTNQAIVIAMYEGDNAQSAARWILDYIQGRHWYKLPPPSQLRFISYSPVL